SEPCAAVRRDREGSMALRAWIRGLAAATGISVGLCGGAVPAAAGDPVPAPVPAPAKPPAAAPAAKTLPDDEPDLQGEEKERHEKSVKAILDSLTKEKNGQLVLDTMKRLGSAPTRAGRDALMLYVVGNGKNQEW